MSAVTGLGIVGCGYAADFYVANLRNHPELSVVGIHDRRPDRMKAFAAVHGFRAFGSLDEMLSRSDIAVILNLTNPTSHVAVSRAALLAGKHVYSEKPMALSLEDAQSLVDLAANRGLAIASAPCTVLGDSFQTLLRAERAGAIGRSLIARCDLHEGAIHRMRHDLWLSRSGAQWPYRDEFATGCVLEHAAYVLDLLVELWGPIRSVTAQSAVVFPTKGNMTCAAPDWASGTVAFDAGRLARIALSIVEPPDHSLTVIGEEGTLTIDDIWRFDSPVWLRSAQIASAERPHAYLGPPEAVPLVRAPREHRYEDTHDIDQLRGVAALVDGLQRNIRPDGRAPLHVLEGTLALAAGGGTRHAMRTGL